MLTSSELAQQRRQGWKDLAKIPPQGRQFALEVGRPLVGLAMQSGGKVSFLSPLDTCLDFQEEENDEHIQERCFGLMADQMVLGDLSIEANGSSTGLGEIAPTLETLAKTPLKLIQKDGVTSVVDPFGNVATINGVLSRQGEFTHCFVDKPLMVQKWFAPGPLESGALQLAKELIAKCETVQTSLSNSGPWQMWDTFKIKGGTVTIRSRLAIREHNEFARSHVLAKVHCTYGSSEVDEDGMPACLEDLNRFEDALLVELKLINAPATEIAVVTRPDRQELWFEGWDHDSLGRSLHHAVAKVGDAYPFKIQRVRVDGKGPAQEKLVWRLTPPDDRLRTPSALWNPPIATLPKWRAWRGVQKDQIVEIRSRLTSRKLRRFAADHFWAIVRCRVSDDVSKYSEQLQTFEEAVVEHIATAKAEAFEIAVVTGNHYRQFYFLVSNRRQFREALEIFQGSNPLFDVTVKLMEGDPRKAVRSLGVTAIGGWFETQLAKWTVALAARKGERLSR